MRLFTINNTSLFMTALLSDKETVFDQFLLVDAVIMTGTTFTIDGHINKSFYNDEELEELRRTASGNGRIYSEDFIRWEAVKEHCFNCIKGKKTPLSLRINFCLAPENIIRFLKTAETGLNAGDVRSLNANIKYDGSTLTCTTAVSLSIFTMDKTLENAWDDMFARFLSQHGFDHD